MKKSMLVLVVIFCLTLTGACSRGLSGAVSDQVVEYPAPAEPVMAFEESEAAGVPSALGVDDGAVARSQSGELPNQEFTRMVIRNADLTLVVEDPLESLETITQMAEELGGFVVNSSVYQTNYSGSSDVYNASITIRVEAEQFNQALGELKDSALDVRNENVYGQDVTQEYTDLESNLRNAELAEQELQELLDRAVDAEDVLAIYAQLRQIRGEIELIKGRMQYIEQSVSLSAISVELIADEAAQPIEIGGWRPAGIAKEAIEDLIRGLQSLAEFLIRFGICGLPILLLVGVPLYFIVRTIRRKRQETQEAQSPSDPSK
jgi:hypothetical protein